MPQPKTPPPPDFEPIMYAAGLELGLAFAAATGTHDLAGAIHFLGAARVEIDKAEAVLRAAMAPREAVADNVIPLRRA